MSIHLEAHQSKIYNQVEESKGSSASCNYRRVSVFRGIFLHFQQIWKTFCVRRAEKTNLQHDLKQRQVVFEKQATSLEKKSYQLAQEYSQTFDPSVKEKGARIKAQAARVKKEQENLSLQQKQVASGQITKKAEWFDGKPDEDERVRKAKKARNAEKVFMQPGQFLTSSALDTYLSILLENHPRIAKNVVLVREFFAGKPTQFDYSEAVNSAIKEAIREKKQFISIPIVDSNHIVHLLIEIHHEEKKATIEFFDSFGYPSSEYTKTGIQKLIKKTIEPSLQGYAIKHERNHVVLQKDKHNCGIFVIKHFEARVLHHTPVDKMADALSFARDETTTIQVTTYPEHVKTTLNSIEAQIKKKEEELKQTRQYITDLKEKRSIQVNNELEKNKNSIIQFEQKNIKELENKLPSEKLIKLKNQQSFTIEDVEKKYKVPKGKNELIKKVEGDIKKLKKQIFNLEKQKNQIKLNGIPQIEKFFDTIKDKENTYISGSNAKDVELVRAQCTHLLDQAVRDAEFSFNISPPAQPPQAAQPPQEGNAINLNNNENDF